MEMEKGKISWEPTNLGDTAKQPILVLDYTRF